jgi:hypothetical protein
MDAQRFDLKKLAAMNYDDALQWAGADFARAVADRDNVGTATIDIDEVPSRLFGKPSDPI